MRIAIDAMGGDKGLSVVIPAVKNVLSKDSNMDIVLVGKEEEIRASLVSYNIQDCHRVTIVHAAEVVGMDELPATALRYKKNSSMRVGVDLVKSGQADAFVSAGNTGALMATSKFVLKTIEGIDRPAIVSALPTVSGSSYLLDLGANINCTSENLYQFAIMGAILKSSLSSSNCGIKPKVALLNIGEEEIKGTELIREASRLLSSNKLINYIGYVEADKLYNDAADVIVCDGFVGNIALKTSEGLSKFITKILKDTFMGTWYGKVVGLLAIPIIKTIRKKLDPGNYNGASFIGLNGIVIKSHGSADSYAFANAIMYAKSAIENNVIKHLKENNWMLNKESRDI